MVVKSDVLRSTFPQSHFGYTLTSVYKRERFSQSNIGSFYCSTIRHSDCFVAQGLTSSAGCSFCTDKLRHTMQVQ